MCLFLVRPRRELKISPKKLGNTETKQCLIFAKLRTQRVFSPIQLQTKTLQELINQLGLKFSDFPSKRLSHIYFRTSKNLLFYFNEDMMDQILPNHVIEVEIEADPDEPSLFCVTLSEIKPE